MFVEHQIENVCAHIMFERASRQLNILQEMQRFETQSRGAGLNQTKFIQIFSDIDDTLYASGLSYARTHIAGVDERLPSKTFYPCVKKIYKEIYNNYGNLPIVFVSARPFGIDRKQIELKHVLDVECIVYGGDFTSVGALWGDFEAMANRKIESIKLHTSATNRDIINFWFGDNGQGDEITAVRLLEENVIHSGFIHIVNSSKKSIKHPNLFYFCTYADVAKILRDRYQIYVHCKSDRTEYAYAAMCTTGAEEYLSPSASSA